ncbi:MAG: segregation/condensation protein A [bacterium]
MMVDRRPLMETVPPSEDEDSDNGAPVRLPVDVEGFSGPLDLLVHLIAKHEIDIISISLATITDAFLVVIREWETKDLDLAGEYLVLAATLVRYKSRSLLPREEVEEEEENGISDDLLRQRQEEYERFREAAARLRAREEEVSSLFPRLGPSAEQPEEVIEFAEVSVYDLYATFKRILEEIGTGEIRTIEPEDFSVDEKMIEVESLLEGDSPLLLSAYLRTFMNRMEIIVIFLALLELIRLKIVRARQEAQHGEIWLERGPGRSEMTDQELHDIIDEEPTSQVSEHKDFKVETEG